MNDPYYKHYIFSDPIPFDNNENTKNSHFELGTEKNLKSQVLDNNAISEVLNLLKIGINNNSNDKALDFIAHLIAAEETANIISDRLNRLFVPTVQLEQPTVETRQIEYPSITPVQERIWISKSYDAKGTPNLTINGGKEILKLDGPGKIIETILISPSANFGMQIFVDGEYHYSGSYTELTELTKADSRLGVYWDVSLERYVMRTSDIKFREQFVFLVSTYEEITFDRIRVNYELLEVV